MYPALVEYLNRQQIIPKLRWWTLGATVDLGFAVFDWFVSNFYVYLSIVLVLVIIGGFVYLFGCSLLFLWLLFSLIFFFLFSPLSSEPCGWQRLGALAWCQAWAPEVGEPSSWHWTIETSWPNVISIGESSTTDLHLNAKTKLHPTASKLQCWMLHDNQLARQEHNPTH